MAGMLLKFSSFFCYNKLLVVFFLLQEAYCSGFSLLQEAYCSRFLLQEAYCSSFFDTRRGLIVVVFLQFFKGLKIIPNRRKAFKKMFCKETKIDGDFDTKIVLGSGHVLAFQVLWRRHTQAQES